MNDKMSFEDKYSVVGTRNTKYDGTFFTAVKTTGVFCHPSCRARIPKAENVLFYDTIQEALQNGYRPCKVCKPLEKIGETPVYIKNIIAELQQNPHKKISDEHLRSKGIEPHTIRRWFKKNYAITFHSFQRMLRINYAFNNIKKGRSITHSAFESGYDSLSGFNESYRSLFGESASKSRNKNVINVLRFSSPIGSIIACATEKGLCYLGFIGQKHIEKQFAEIQKQFNAIILPGKNIHLTKVRKEVNEYFDGNRKEFSVSLDIIGTDFRKQVWNELLKIPYGKTVSYKEQALAMNNQKAIRAVASANGANKISIIIPCHRVVGSNGSLTGYAGGLHRKSWFLNFEKNNSDQPIQKVMEYGGV
ncbi:Methylated-DNA--protein-cysteine methyltransferase [hydrothermal vent metagenome]|uniref:methylated-DNA--[protein]-cysteine S-methyltransferase n=1 Tax=hydrothermal vent metagenome TaxID=652676 RepID=A0A3B0THB7_9ZZZZ